jgi:hypothetical protein
MNSPTTTSWTDANQRLMVAEFGRLKQRLGAEGDAESLNEALQSASAAMPAPAAIDHLSDCFGLSAFERDVLLLCAGVEMDSQLAAQCEIAAGESHRQGATFGLALAALDAPHWSALAPVSPLRRWRLVEVDELAGVARGRLRIDERILHYLAGVNYLDLRLRSLLREATPPTAMANAHRAPRSLRRRAQRRRNGHCRRCSARVVDRRRSTGAGRCGRTGRGSAWCRASSAACG